MNSVYNNQGRKSGGYRKVRLDIPLMSNGEPMLHPSLPCRENRHRDCDGYLTFMPKRPLNECACECHV